MTSPAEAGHRFHPLLTVFGVRRPVSRAAYVGTGAVLLVLKYGVENALVYGSLARWLTPAEFLSPFFAHRAALLATVPAPVAWALVALHLPFLWIGLSMSSRRAIDAGLKPWWGFLFILPWVQYVLMAALSILPHRPSRAQRLEASPFRASPISAPDRPLVPSHATLFRLLRATVLGCAVTVGMLAIMLEWLPSHWILLPLPVGGFVAGAVAVRTRAPNAKGRPAPLRTLAYGIALISLIPLFFWISEGLGKNMGTATLLPVLFLTFIAPSVLYGLFLSGWSVGTSAGLAGAALDRRDLDTSEGALGPVARVDQRDIAEQDGATDAPMDEEDSE